MFHELYSEIFLQWKKLQGGNFTEDLKYFGDCGVRPDIHSGRNGP